ncbi:UNVERIFIED_CONTAM: hypothetical protein GTU68_031536 [Idotea baltica]|nr:hypothetical protein [Idotea baltica]
MGFLDNIKKRIELKKQDSKVQENVEQANNLVEQEKAAQERLEKERAEERVRNEKLAAEKKAVEELAKDKAANEKAAQERLEKERAEAQAKDKKAAAEKRQAEERLAKEKEEKLRKEKAEQARIEAEAKQKAEAEKIAKEKADKERLEAEKLEKERLEKERLTKERAEKEKGGFWSNFFGRGEKSTDAELQKDLDDGIQQTKQGFFSKISKAVAGKTEVDDELLDEIEEALVSSDVGVETTVKIIEKLEAKVASQKYFGTKELYRLVKEVVVDLLSENNTQNLPDYEFPDKGKYPYVVLVVGVNGVGKTTTIAKLAAKAKSQGKKVVLGAGDTFRAAAVKQIEVWGERIGVPVISHGMDTDPAAVAYDTVKVAMEQNADVVFVDTAGRLHNKVGLMNELSKIKRVMQKIVPDVPHDVLLVLDASTGQNALEQAKHFTEATQVSCLAVTKLDGTAKGGVILGIADQFSIPIRYIGVGEQVHHLQLFNKEKFVETLFAE